MRSFPVRSLNQDTAAVLARVQQGNTVEITNRGRVVARITPVVANELESLIERGRVVPATISGRIPFPVGDVDTINDSARIVSELREERV